MNLVEIYHKNFTKRKHNGKGGLEKWVDNTVILYSNKIK